MSASGDTVRAEQLPVGGPQARALIEASRHLARLSRDQMMPGLLEQLKSFPDAFRKEMSKKFQEARMELVMDCYLTGCAEMLKHLMGDPSPEPWAEYDHESRLDELLAQYRQRQPEVPPASAGGKA